MIDNIQYRLVLCSSAFTLETHFSSQAFHILTELDQLPFARHLDQSARDARPPLPFGWAWWIDENKVCGKGGDRVNDDGTEVQGSPIKQGVCDSGFDLLDYVSQYLHLSAHRRFFRPFFSLPWLDFQDDQPLGPSRLVVNSNLNELKKLARVYLDLLMKAVNLFDRPTP
jgi:hypothetical protein